MNMIGPEFTKFHFDYEYGERLAYEAQARGHLGGVKVELSDGTLHSVFFYDTVRLAQDLDEEIKLGRPFVGEKGMIIVREVTLENMTAAVRFLATQGFFGEEPKAYGKNIDQRGER